MMQNKKVLPLEAGSLTNLPDPSELRAMLRPPVVEFVAASIPTEAKTHMKRFAAVVRSEPVLKEMPRWLQALVEERASAEKLTEALFDRVHRAPSHKNQELALVVANEIARMPGGSAVLETKLTPEFMGRLRERESGKR